VKISIPVLMIALFAFSIPSIGKAAVAAEKKMACRCQPTTSGFDVAFVTAFTLLGSFGGGELTSQVAQTKVDAKVEQAKEKHSGLMKVANFVLDHSKKARALKERVEAKALVGVKYAGSYPGAVAGGASGTVVGYYLLNGLKRLLGVTDTLDCTCPTTK
jgi:hypothetical protein